MADTAIVFEDQETAYFVSKPLDIPAAPSPARTRVRDDIQIARDDDGHIIAAHGSPFDGYRAWMEMALACELYGLATELVMEMAAGEEVAASISRAMRPGP